MLQRLVRSYAECCSESFLQGMLQVYNSFQLQTQGLYLTVLQYIQVDQHQD